MSVDINKVAAGAITELTKVFFRNLKDSSIDFFSKKYSYLFEDFGRYMDATYQKCNNVRTIINKDQSFEIDNIYVRGKFKSSDKEISDVELIQNIRDRKPAVIIGFGGIGKTVFLKNLWMSIYREPMDSIPIFLELRKFNSFTDIDLLTYVRRTISPGDGGVSADVFERFLLEGRFVFLLDGFDELRDEHKPSVSDKIVELGYQYPKNGIVVSSRHDDRFYSWQRFSIYKACPFEKKQVLELMANIPYDKETKRKFIAEIVNRKYESYKTFMSTPLLSLMMLMTFSSFAEVPDKRNVFYRYAFMTLYSWHDSSKESFNREKQTGLHIDQFENVFSIFCLVSYIQREIEFDERKILKHFDSVKKYVDFDFDSKKLLIESTDSVNLIYKDGDKFVFTHRSFQEYFAAFAAVSYFQNKLTELVQRLNQNGDIVLSLMYEINSAVVDQHYISAAMPDAAKQIENLIEIKDDVVFAEMIRLGYLVVLDYRRPVNSRFSMAIQHISSPVWVIVRSVNSFVSEQDFDVDEYSTKDVSQSIVDICSRFSRKAPGIDKEDEYFGYLDVSRMDLYIAPFRQVGDLKSVDVAEHFRKVGIHVPITSKKLKKDMSGPINALRAQLSNCLETGRAVSRRLSAKEKGIDELLG